MNKEFNVFNSNKDKLAFMKKYELASKTMSSIPRLYYSPHGDTIKKCDLLGYVKEYESWCTMIIDYGDGPTAIHSDYLHDMQTFERQKGKSLKTYADSFVVFDFETTGINLKSCEIIQIGALKIENGKVIDTFNEFVHPDNPIPEKITALTGITDLDVWMADSIDIVLKKFLDFIDNSILVGYNISSFDTTLLYDHAKYLYNIDVSNDFIDLRYIAESYFKSNKIDIANCKLTTIADYFGIDTENAHRALHDCYITLDCYNKIFDKAITDVPDNSISINNITNELERSIFNILQEIIEKEELPKDSLYLHSNVSHKGEKKGTEITKSICVNEPEYPPNTNNKVVLGKNDTFAQIIYKKNNKVEFKIKTKYLSALELPADCEVSDKISDPQFTNIILDINNSNIHTFIKALVLTGLKFYESNSSFGCCSQFKKCSDEKKCVHLNKLYSKGCKYRSNLDAGRIFYGKNRNVD